MHPMVLLIGALLAGGPRVSANAPGEHTPTARRLVFDCQGSHSLEGELFAPPETTPPLDGYTLYEVDSSGRRQIAQRVGAALFLPGGALLVVQQGDLLVLQGEKRRLLSSGLFPDLAVDVSGRFAAVVRTIADGTAIELLDLADGRTLRRLTASRGFNTNPTFGPDGTLLFVSSRTGLASIFKVGLDGKGEKQLSNVGARSVGPNHVPPPDRVGERRIEGRSLTWSVGGERWSLDLSTGVARRVGGAP